MISSLNVLSKSNSITTVVLLVLAIGGLYVTRTTLLLPSYHKKDNGNISGNANSISTSLAVATRIHKGNSSQMTSFESIAEFVRSVSYAKVIILCIGIGDKLENIDYINKLETYLQVQGLIPSASSLSTSLSYSSILILPVTPWGKFTMALNAIVHKCIDEKFDLVAFQSLEFRIKKETVNKLVNIIKDDTNTLVVGPALPGHDFKAGLNNIEGRTCPWNTFAIWNVNHLGLVGFPMVGDGMGTETSGVEEVTTVNLLQKINNRLKVVLVSSKGVEWRTEFKDDEKRQQYHDEKMKSKNERPEKQMKWLGIQSGRVSHIIEE